MWRVKLSRFSIDQEKSRNEKQRAAKDNAEIKKLADQHFKQRAADDEKVKELEERIAKTQKVWFNLIISFIGSGSFERATIHVMLTCYFIDCKLFLFL